MIESAREAGQYLEGVSREDFREKRPVQHCVIRCIEIVGEAASRVSENLRIAHDEIQWRHIVGMRNRIIHAYFEIELDLVWKTVTEELPILIPRLEAIRKELETQTR